MLAGQTPYAFARQTRHLTHHVVEENGRPDIDPSWPENTKDALEGCFEADMNRRPVSA